ncbi:MAG: hypothetical protein GY716_10555 [bacterium]|nr:hypothetical protein [bacterium]
MTLVALALATLLATVGGKYVVTRDITGTGTDATLEFIGTGPRSSSWI